MKRLALCLLACAVGACDPGDQDQNPRDRVGSDGPLSWRLVEQKSGAAAFLSRPGAAPDLVLWCDDQQRITLRAHVFPAPSAQPNLVLTTKVGRIAFQEVRRQGGVREGDRKLVEGKIGLAETGVAETILAASDFTLTSGDVDYRAQPVDRDQILPAFVTACRKEGPKAP
ncbi:MAG: hypothetical protein ACK5XZ_02440 [Hyphomonadaceae bacterium]|jgi:hypothetical protein|uniref:hypothetical protein n=1 Tax=Aquidulcibacter sp. TaxID=2052990 RepID=UPI0022C331B5|nr:hypothetical protein [Aquidulcibacter sp.]MCE2891875.1 hypothetical protein [Hyphomonadaceae bacterium]MCZ8209886.1 hypothetical protein [Aquidulcibacter sp.]